MTADPEATPGAGERILFVDDEPPLARLGQRRLEGLGYTVTVATSGGQALALFRADPYSYDLVITDYTMPDRTGLELAAEIARTRPGIPVVLTTGHVEEIGAEALQSCGVREVLMKPVLLTELARAISGALRPPSPR